MINTAEVNAEQLLCEADPFGMTIGRLGNVETREEAASRIEELRKDLEQSPWFADVETDLEKLDIVAHTEVSPEIAVICAQEMRNAEKCGWRIID